MNELERKLHGSLLAVRDELLAEVVPNAEDKYDLTAYELMVRRLETMAGEILSGALPDRSKRYEYLARAAAEANPKVLGPTLGGESSTLRSVTVIFRALPQKRLNLAMGGIHMKVESITWLSKAAQEAELAVKSSVGETIKVFSCPCELSVGELLAEPLHVFLARNVQLARSADDPSQELLREQISQLQELGYQVRGRVVDVAQRQVLVRGFLMQLEEPLPGGVNTDDVVEFSCARIDFW